MPPRKRTIVIDADVQEPDAIDRVREENVETIAEELSSAIQSMSAFDDSKVKAHLYKKERGGNKRSWVCEYYPPFDEVEIFRDMRERYNGGDFELRFMVSGKPGVQALVSFSVMPGPVKPERERSDAGEMVPLMLQMMQGSSDRQMQMIMQMNQQSQQMFAQMNASQAQLMQVLIPAMMGGREKTSELMQAFAALRGKDDGPLSGMAGVFAAMKEAKGLFAPERDDVDFDPDDSLVKNAIKLGGPLVAAVGDALRARQAQPVQLAAVEYATAAPAPSQPSPQLPSPAFGEVMPAGVLRKSSRFALVDLVAKDVLFHFERGRTPEFAAEAVYALIEEARAPQGWIDELTAAFAISTDWLADLAGEGIDLRANPEWAQRFLTELVQLHADAQGELSDSQREDGSGTNAEPDGGAG